MRKAALGCAGGIKLENLKDIRDIINFSMEAMKRDDAGEQGTAFVEPLNELIRLHGVPFDMDKAYQEIAYAQDISANWQTLVKAFELGIPSITITVAETISAYVKQEGGLPVPPSMENTSIPDILNIDLSSAPPSQIRYYIVAHSGLIKPLMDALQLAADQDNELSLTLLTAARDLSSNTLSGKCFNSSKFLYCTGSLSGVCKPAPPHNLVPNPLSFTNV